MDNYGIHILKMISKFLVEEPTGMTADELKEKFIDMLEKEIEKKQNKKVDDFYLSF